MDPTRFDALARVLSDSDSRRGVLGLLAATPIVGGLLGLLTPEETEGKGRRKRRKTRHKRRSGDDKKNRKGKHKKKKQPTCTPTTCAAQGKTCGRLPDGCGKTLDCGPCTCATGCSVCQVCNPATDQCDSIPNDTPCDDGDLCTQSAACQNGTCVGGSPVVCPPPDQCHVQGVCNPATGTCSTPNRPNGATCDDGNLCTINDVCTDGVCSGAPVVCATPPGPCYQPTGTCQLDGTCRYAFKPQGAACTDGNACTQSDTCDGSGTCIAGTPVVCPPPDQCHVQGVCNPGTGICSNPVKCGGGQICRSDGTCCLPDPADPGSCCLPDTSDLQEAIGSTATGGTLPLCAGTWKLSSTVVISRNLTLIGAGDGQTVLDGRNAVRVLDISSGTVTLQDLTITKGRESSGAGIFNNRGTVTLLGVAVSDNTANSTGGIYNTSMGTLTLGAGSRVTGNAATGASCGGIRNDGKLTLQNGSRVTGNTAFNSGGGIRNQGTLILQNGSRVSGNTAPFGGGIANFEDGSVTVEPEALVCDNSATQCYGDPITGCPNPSDGICPS